PRIAHQFGEIIAGGFELVKRNADTPDVKMQVAGQDFLAQRFGAAVKRTIVLPKTEIWGVLFREPRAVRSTPRINATRGYVTPRHIGRFAGLGDDPGKYGIAGQALRLMNLAGIHIGLSGVSGRVDEKL